MDDKLCCPGLPLTRGTRGTTLSQHRSMSCQIIFLLLLASHLTLETETPLNPYGSSLPPAFSIFLACLSEETSRTDSLAGEKKKKRKENPSRGTARGRSTFERQRIPNRRGTGPENEVKGPKLLLLHFGLRLCIFLVGMVGIPIYYVAYLNLTAKRTGLQSDCNGNFGHYS